MPGLLLPHERSDRFGRAQQVAGADPASPDLEFGAILALGWPGSSDRGRWAADHNEMFLASLTTRLRTLLLLAQ